MARDPGRQFLQEQIQNSMDFLDSYLDNVLAGPRTECVVIHTNSQQILHVN